MRILVDFQIGDANDRIVFNLLLGTAQDARILATTSSRLNGLVT